MASHIQPSSGVDQPSEWLARGRWEAPSWVIGLLGGLLVASGISYFAWRVRRARRVGR